LLVLALLVDIGARSAVDRLTDDAPASPLRDAAAGRDQPWRGALALEVKRIPTRYDPQLGWTMPRFDGRYVHVKNGIRRSYQPAGSRSAKAITVFFFGGSSMFGVYQRDEHTIPSDFARLAERDGIRLRVVNHGQQAYVNWQELLLLEQLVTGRSVPDLAIFYDWFNEVYTQFLIGPHAEPTHQHAPEYEASLRLGHKGDASSALSTLHDFWASRSALHELAHLFAPAQDPNASPWPGERGHRPEDLGGNAASIYARGVQAARRFAESYGFRAAFFWQPFLYSKRLVPGERLLVGSDRTDPGAWRTADNVARSRLEAPVRDLSGALDGVHAPVMYDLVHTNELGAKRVAEALYTRLRPTLLELSRRQRR
jgi:hypothetical protein